ncbi:MAG: tyrosine-type recombinase/integrase [Acidimicrobiales bacterium]
MSARPPISPDDEDLVALFAAALESSGLVAWKSTIDGARAFCRRYGTPARFESAFLDSPLPQNMRAFARWLLVTGRMQVSAEYLVRFDLRLGVAARRHHSELYELFASSAATLGSDDIWVRAQWNLLAQLGGLHGVVPRSLTAAQVADGGARLLEASRHPQHPKAGFHRRTALLRLKATMFHAGLIDVPPRLVRPDRSREREVEWAGCGPIFVDTAKRYVNQIALSLGTSTVSTAERTIREFASFLTDVAPDVRGVADVTRQHVESYKLYLVNRPRLGGGTLNKNSIRTQLFALRSFFERIAEWGYEDAPSRPLLFDGDIPIADQPLPRFLDDAKAAKLLRAARIDPNLFVRVVVEVLARTGMRLGELMALEVDAVVQIGSAYWLRVPVGKLHNDRYVPLHPQLKELFDEWMSRRSPELRSKLVFTEWGRPIPAARVNRALARLGREAGIGKVTAHQLRHTLATQAINRGMSLEAIAALLGHRTLAMTMVYARIADRTVANEYFSVSEKVEALYGSDIGLPASAEGTEMGKLRRELDRRMLGNGWCARPAELDCHFESICESCTFFVTTVEFRPTLERQRIDAAEKGQVGREKIFDGLITRLDEAAS